jgi:hypothetical protein
VTHFVSHPLSSIDVPGVDKAITLEAVGPTENMKGEKMLDKMKAKCTAVSIDFSGGKQYINGACALTDSDGDIVFSTFDTRTSTSRSQKWTVALTSSPAAPGSTPASPGVSHSSALPRRHRPVSRLDRSR